MQQFVFALISLSLLLTGCGTSTSYPLLTEPDLNRLSSSYAWAPPSRFDNDIAAFEAEGEQPKGAIVAIGSSSMRCWHDHIDQDLEPLTIIKRGFGGSEMNDVVTFADRIILPYEPRAVLLYEGDNDTAGGKIPPEGVLEAFRALQYKIHSVYPETRIYIIAIKPSVLRWETWAGTNKANQLLAAEAQTDPRITFIDVATPMLGEDGKPDPAMYVDELHMNRKGYELWRDLIRPVLMENELANE